MSLMITTKKKLIADKPKIIRKNLTITIKVINPGQRWRWWTKSTWSSPPPTTAIKTIHLRVEKFSWKIKVLAEDFIRQTLQER